MRQIPQSGRKWTQIHFLISDNVLTKARLNGSIGYKPCFKYLESEYDAILGVLNSWLHIVWLCAIVSPAEYKEQYLTQRLLATNIISSHHSNIHRYRKAFNPIFPSGIDVYLNVINIPDTRLTLQCAMPQTILDFVGLACGCSAIIEIQRTIQFYYPDQIRELCRCVAFCVILWVCMDI
jgi:hypothetical protein